MMSLPWRAVLTRRLLIFVLSLVALICLPLASRDIVRDASFSLLLPVTMAGFACAWALASLKLSNGRAQALLFLGGPLVIFLWVGHAWQPLTALLKETLLLLPPALEWHAPAFQPDPSVWMAAFKDLASQVILIAGRVAAWLPNASRGGYSQDPTARALVGSTAFWLLASWGGWQLRRNERPFAGMVPASLLLGLLILGRERQMALLWVHLCALVPLLGLARYEQRIRTWQQNGRDYVELVGTYSLLSVGVLGVLLVGAAFLASITSVKDLMDRFREQRPSARAEAHSSSTSAGQGRTITGAQDIEKLMAPHPILAGPELSEDLVMVIYTGDLPRMPRSAHPAPPYYRWRTITYERYDGRGWNNPSEPMQEIPAGQALLQQLPAEYRLVHQEVHFPKGSAGRLYWANTLLRANIPVQAAWHNTAAGDLLSVFSREQAYEVYSIQLQINPEQLNAAGMDYPASVQRYLALPENIPERVLALARDLTASAATPYERAIAIESYLRKIPYALDVPAPPGGFDAVDYFLFDLKRGYCDYYATAMVVLSRAAGLPARFVTGYASGSYDPESASYLVKSLDAHSWAEIYFPGTGWVEFEPTSSQPPPAWEARQEEAVPLFHPEQPRSKLIDTLWSLKPHVTAGMWLVFLIGIGFALAWERLKTGWLARHRPAAALSIYYRQVRRTARPLTGRLPASQTICEYRTVLDRELGDLTGGRRIRNWIMGASRELDEMTALYNTSLFAAQAPGQEQIMAARQAWLRLRWKLLAATVIARLSRRKPGPEEPQPLTRETQYPSTKNHSDDSP